MGIIAGRYRYLQELLQLDSNIVCDPPYSWPRGPSSLCVEVFEGYLKSHPDRNFANYILRGLSTGFRVGHSYTRLRKLRSRGCNHPSCLANQGVVAAHFGRSFGWSSGWTNPADVSQQGPHKSNGVSNDGISEDLCSLQYASLDDALRLICHLGPECELVKMDLKNAFRVGASQ